jgi:hypothetical protein
MMGIVLIVAILVVAVAVLYVTVTLSTRTRQTTAPLVDDAFKGVSGQIDAAAQNLSRQIADELQQDKEERMLDGRKIQGRLDHADSRASSMANEVLAELDTIRRLVEQVGVRQDQLSADLGKLDHKVARLGESLAQPSASRVPAVQPQPAPRQPPAARPGQLYAERLRFSIAGARPESYSSRAERQYRIQVERQIGALPSPQPGALDDPPAIIHRAALDEGFRKRLGEAASDYFATRLGDPASAVATEQWVTQNAYPETALVEVCNRISSGLDTIVEKPLEKIGTQLLLPGPEAATAPGIGAALILQPVTEPLGQAAAFLEITGVVVGMATGLHPLTLAAAKMLAHDQFHVFVARRLREAARQVFDGPAEAREPVRAVAQPPEVNLPETSTPPTIPSEAAAQTLPPQRPPHGSQLQQPAAPQPPEEPQPPEAPQPDPVHPDWWDDRPSIGGPGSG